MWEKAIRPAPAEPPRRTFALTGPSISIDPRHNAIRPDLADIRLAEYVFAPHYAAPLPCVVTRAVTLHAVEPRSTARNLWAVEVAEIELSGDRARVHLDGPISLVAEATPRALSELGLHPGAAIWASVKATEVDVYPM